MMLDKTNDYPKVLIVDDDKVLAETLGRSFARRFYDFRIAHSTQEALLTVVNFKPDFAVVDLRMPGASGLECVKGLHSFNSETKIVVLTGYASLTTAIEAVKLGACYYLAKPANVEDIIKGFAKSEGTTDVVIGHKKSSLKTIEWERINEVLVETNYNISHTAKRLGMHRRTLARKLSKKPVT